MRDVKAMLLPGEEVQYQYAYPLWLKITAGVAIGLFGLALANDLRGGDGFLLALDAALVGYSVYWLVLMLREGSALYVVTNRRVMRLGGAAGAAPGKASPGTAGSDVMIDYAQISAMRSWKDGLSGNGYVLVTAAGGESIRVPVVNIGRGRTEALARQVEQYRAEAQGTAEGAPGSSGEEGPAERP